MKDLDIVDLQILNILQEDFNTPVKEISEKTGLSSTPIYERIKALKNSGVIKRNAVIVNRDALGYGIMSYCYITLKEQSLKLLLEFEEKVKSEPQILEVVSMTGTYDYMMKIVAKNINDYNNFMMRIIADIPNIGQYHSAIVLSEVKNETKIPLELDIEK